MRINKLLSNKGICSRKQAHELILAGRIKVNGVLCTPGQWVEEEDSICIDNTPLCAKKKVYLVLNKPVGVTCTSASEVKDNIVDYMAYPEYIFPVGRLDKPSQGLILLTNDGDLANLILDAAHYHEKEYRVTVDRPFEKCLLEDLAKGVDLGNVVTRPCQVEAESEDTLRITITQGLNRQIRRMCKAFGYDVVRLERIRILNITLDELPYGKWRELGEKEIVQLKVLQSSR
ncbi:MAG: pseudouridine synthase [Cellulosilyticaceae bacterium]